MGRRHHLQSLKKVSGRGNNKKEDLKKPTQQKLKWLSRFGLDEDEWG
jgi:hypothetical protein